MYGAIAGQLTVGRYVLQVGEPWGAMVREVSRVERHISPRPHARSGSPAAHP